jgi:hypothetical protein
MMMKVGEQFAAVAMLDGLLVKLALGINPSDRNGIHARMWYLGWDPKERLESAPAWK